MLDRSASRLFPSVYFLSISEPLPHLRRPGPDNRTVFSGWRVLRGVGRTPLTSSLHTYSTAVRRRTPTCDNRRSASAVCVCVRCSEDTIYFTVLLSDPFSVLEVAYTPLLRSTVQIMGMDLHATTALPVLSLPNSYSEHQTGGHANAPTPTSAAALPGRPMRC